MERKLIRQGGGGYTVYLPKHWVDKKGLGSGAKVQVLETETSLVITSAIVQPRIASIAIDVKNRNDLRNILTHLYRRGFDAVILTGVDSLVLQEVTQVAQDLLLGFEVTGYDGSSCRLEGLSEPSEQKYDLLLKRIFLILKETHQTVLRELVAGQFTDEVAGLRKQQDRYLLFCRRSLSRETGRRSISTAWELLTFLMHIEHAYFYLHRYARDNKVKMSVRVQDLLTEVGESIDLYYDAFYKRDFASVHAINAKRDDVIFGKCYRYMLQTKGEEAILISHFREVLRLIQIGMSPILSELLQEELV